MIGRKFTCPNCQQKLEVSAPNEPAPAPRPVTPPASEPVVSVQCACGKKYRVSAKHIGKRLKCATCGETIVCSSSRPAPDVQSEAAGSLSDSPMNADGATAPPQPTPPQFNSARPAPPVRAQPQKKKLNSAVLPLAAVGLLGIGMLAGLVFYSGILTPKASPSRPPAAIAEHDAAPIPTPDPTPLVSADDWAFIPQQAWADQFAMVEPRAKLQADERGLHVSLEAPVHAMELVYRPRLEGDFKVQFEMEIQSHGQYSSPPIVGASMGAELVVGFRDASTMRPVDLRLFLGPDRYSKPFSFTVERIGDRLSHTLGGPGSADGLPPTAKAGYLYIRLCTPALITLKHVACVGTKSGIGFETPKLNILALDENSWGPLQSSRGTNPQKLSLTFGEIITIGPKQSGSVQFNSPVRGDIYLRGKLKVNHPASDLPAGRLSPSITHSKESPVRLFFQDKNSGSISHLLIPVGSDESTFTLLRAGTTMAVCCDGQLVSGSGDYKNAFDTFGFEVLSTNHTVELSELQLYQSQ